MVEDDSRVAALNEAVQRFGEAWARGDAAALDALLSPTYTHTDLFGAFQDRASWLEYAGKRKGRNTQIGIRDVRTRIVGDVAVVTGINDLKGPGVRTAADAAGATIRSTQVWVWRDGRWLREAFQATPQSGPGASAS